MATKTFHQARALDIQEDIASWLGSKEAYRSILTNYYNMYLMAPGVEATPVEEAVRKVESWMPGIMENEIGAVLDQPPTFCTSDYVSMLGTMASAAPKNSLTIADISQTEGLLVFEEAVTFELPGGAPDIDLVRAFSWYISPGAKDSHTIAVSTRVWTEARCAPISVRIPSIHKLFSSPLARANVGFEPRTADDTMTRLLQAHFALLKSPLTRDEPAVRDPKVSPRTKRSLSDNLRRVYLRHPEHARYEADEAAAAREGRAPMRAHWVRGHWRNQRYSKSGENRWIWIAGYIKGNPENGTVSTRKVGIAMASPSELRELAGATV